MATNVRGVRKVILALVGVAAIGGCGRAAVTTSARHAPTPATVMVPGGGPLPASCHELAPGELPPGAVWVRPGGGIWTCPPGAFPRPTAPPLP
jgi:hypothetical protein